MSTMNHVVKIIKGENVFLIFLQKKMVIFKRNNLYLMII